MVPGGKFVPTRLLRSNRVSSLPYFRPTNTSAIHPVLCDDALDQESRTETVLKSLDIEYDNTIHYSDIALISWVRCVYYFVNTVFKLVTGTVLILTILQIALPDWNFNIRELVGVTTIHTSLAWFVTGCFTRMSTVHNEHLGRSIAWVRAHRVRQMVRAIFVWLTAVLSTIMAMIAIILQYSALDDDTNLDDIGVGRPHPEVWLTRMMTVQYTCGIMLAIPVMLLELMELWWFCITSRRFNDPRMPRDSSPEESRLMIDEGAIDGEGDMADIEDMVALGTVGESVRAAKHKQKSKRRSVRA